MGMHYVDVYDSIIVLYVDQTWGNELEKLTNSITINSEILQLNKINLTHFSMSIKLN